MPGEYAAPGSAAEWRLKVRLAEAALKVADAGGMEQALLTLLAVTRGVDENGQTVRASSRTRAIAAARLASVLRESVPTAVRNQGAPSEAPAGPALPATVDARSQHLHLHLHAGAPGSPGAKQDRAAWLAEYARSLEDLQTQARAAAELEALAKGPAPSSNGNGHTNGHDATPGDTEAPAEPELEPEPPEDDDA